MDIKKYMTNKAREIVSAANIPNGLFTEDDYADIADRFMANYNEKEDEASVWAQSIQMQFVIRTSSDPEQKNYSFIRAADAGKPPFVEGARNLRYEWYLPKSEEQLNVLLNHYKHDLKEINTRAMVNDWICFVLHEDTILAIIPMLEISKKITIFFDKLGVAYSNINITQFIYGSKKAIFAVPRSVDDKMISEVISNTVAYIKENDIEENDVYPIIENAFAERNIRIKFGIDKVFVYE